MTKTNKIFRFISRILLLILISLLLGLKLYSWNARTLVGNSMPMPFGLGASVVLSGSMEPEFSVNDLVFIKESNEYKIGDVIVFQDDNSLTMHRIISISRDEIITKGDANNIADSPIKHEDIKGKAVATIPFAGIIVQFIKSTAGFLIMLISAVVLFELPYYHERKKAVDEQEKIKNEIRKLKGE